MSTVPATTVAAHVNSVKGEFGTFSDASKNLNAKVDTIFGALDRLRATELSEEQHAIADEIGTLVTNLKDDTNALTSSATKLKESAVSLENSIPNTAETPRVTTGVTGTGTAANPGTDDVREDDRRIAQV